MKVINEIKKENSLAVFGLGITGFSAVKFFATRGINVFPWDDNPEQIQQMKHIFRDAKNVHFVDPNHYEWEKIGFLILSPGVNLFTKPHYVVSLAKMHGCPLVSDICLFLQMTNAKKIAVTGTNGKSTTTALIAEIICNAKKKAMCGGNIGTSVFDLDLDAEYYVLEVSSFQSDLFYIAPPINIAILLDITKDHLDRYYNFRHYAYSKANIFSDKSSYGLISVDTQVNSEIFSLLDNNNLIPFSTQTKLEFGFSFLDGKIYKNAVIEDQIDSTRVLAENAIAAYSACSILDIDKKIIIDTIQNFRGLEHRIEFIAHIFNITFINDSKATNSVSTNKALSMHKNIFWIAGGKSKTGDDIAMINVKNVQAAYFIGEDGQLFYDIFKFQLKSSLLVTLEEAFYCAVNDARSLAEEVTIILSPACASFDQWKNFEERGRYFKNLVKKMDVELNL